MTKALNVTYRCCHLANKWKLFPICHCLSCTDDVQYSTVSRLEWLIAKLLMTPLLCWWVKHSIRNRLYKTWILKFFGNSVSGAAQMAMQTIHHQLKSSSIDIMAGRSSDPSLLCRWHEVLMFQCFRFEYPRLVHYQRRHLSRRVNMSKMFLKSNYA